MQYTISQAAEKLGIAAHTLRYYEKEGLLPFISRTASGNRRFSQTDMEWLELLQCLKNTGLSLKEIKQFMFWLEQGDSSIEQRHQLFQLQVDKVEKQINELNQYLTILKYKRDFYLRAKRLGSVQAVLEENETKEKFAKENILLPISPLDKSL